MWRNAEEIGFAKTRLRLKTPPQSKDSVHRLLMVGPCGAYAGVTAPMANRAVLCALMLDTSRAVGSSRQKGLLLRTGLRGGV